jgi:hypothetical protein
MIRNAAASKVAEAIGTAIVPGAHHVKTGVARSSHRKAVAEIAACCRLHLLHDDGIGGR